jgi:hypothetical protein
MKGKTNQCNVIRFKVFIAVVMKYSLFWDIATCSPVEIQAKFKRNASPACYQLHADFLLGYFSDPEDGDDIILRNTG